MPSTLTPDISHSLGRRLLKNHELDLSLSLTDSDSEYPGSGLAVGKFIRSFSSSAVWPGHCNGDMEYRPSLIVC